ncbi:alpha/beta hydrolase [Streptomyces goshikiensis]|uniref:alpha/beta hydrolase n=1 Tax=Streptomyces goshikiensis TaxID=1942 RepID=UPI00365D0A95
MHRSRRFRRLRRSSAAVTAAAALAAALAAAPSPGTGTGTDDGLDRFYGQQVRWGACPQRRVPDGMRCGEITVPLDYADPAKGSIRLALARIPATGGGGPRLGSVLLNYGGPGGPGIENLAADPKSFADLGKRYDLVTFDPRGVGHSEPVSCGGSLELDSSAGDDAASQLAALRLLVRRCELHSGPVLPYIGTVHVARDLDVMRQVLGDPKLNYLGFSYGTRLGAVYAAQFPGKTGRMVLDGVDTLTEPLVEQALVSARGQQRALDGFLGWCARRPGCVYGTNTRTAKEKVNALVARLDARPLVDGGRYVTGRDVVAAVAAALYAPAMWPALADGLRRIERDADPSALTRLGEPAEPADESEADGARRIPADNADAALAAVNCADDPDRGEDKAAPAAVEQEIRGLIGEFRAASKIFGPSQLMTVLSCYGRPAGTDFIRRIDRPAGLPRILLVGTRGDPATPYEWTEETARRLGGSAVVLDNKGDGHTGYTTSACVRDFVNHFLVDGGLPSGTRACPAGQ